MFSWNPLGFLANYCFPWKHVTPEPRKSKEKTQPVPIGACGIHFELNRSVVGICAIDPQDSTLTCFWCDNNTAKERLHANIAAVTIAIEARLREGKAVAAALANCKFDAEKGRRAAKLKLIAQQKDSLAQTKSQLEKMLADIEATELTWATQQAMSTVERDLRELNVVTRADAEYIRDCDLAMIERDVSVIDKVTMRPLGVSAVEDDELESLCEEFGIERKSAPEYSFPAVPKGTPQKKIPSAPGEARAVSEVVH
jgi:hypothetical protein